MTLRIKKQQLLQNILGSCGVERLLHIESLVWKYLILILNFQPGRLLDNHFGIEKSEKQDNHFGRGEYHMNEAILRSQVPWSVPCNMVQNTRLAPWVRTYSLNAQSLKNFLTPLPPQKGSFQNMTYGDHTINMVKLTRK